MNEQRPSECASCDGGGEVLACTHYADQSVTMYRRPAGFLSCVRRRGEWEAEGHIGGTGAAMWRTYAKQVEYIRR